MDTIDRQLVPLLNKVRSGPMSKHQLKQQLGNSWRLSDLEVATRRGHVELRWRNGAAGTRVGVYHITDSGKAILQETTKMDSPSFDLASMGRLQVLAMQYGLDFRMSYISKHFQWTVRLTHPVLDHPICSGYGPTAADAAQQCEERADFAISSAIPVIKHKIGGVGKRG